MVRIALVAACCFFASCGVLDPEVEGIGTVTFTQIEGGCWTIETSSERYWPTNLPENLRVHGLRVQFEASNRNDLAGFCPGLPIELIWIEAVPGGEGGE